MPAAIFGQRGHAQIGAERDRALHHRTEQGVVDHHQRARTSARADRIGDGDDHRDVDDRGGRVGRALDDDQLERPLRQRRIHCRLDAGPVATIGKGGLAHAEPRHQRGIEPVGPAIDRPAEHHAVTGPQMRQRDGAVRRHAAVEHRRGFRAVQRRQPRLDHVKIGVAEPRIDMTRATDLGAGAIEIGLMNILRLLRRGISEGRGHVDGRLGCLGAVGGIITRADGERLGAPRGVVVPAHAAARSR